MLETNAKILPMVLLNELKAFLYFPVWWYSKGLFKMLIFAKNLILEFNLVLGFTIWVKNLFVPMFGQRDIAGRLISIALRIVNVIFRGIGVLFLSLIVFVLVAIWVILPIFIILQILNYIF